MKCRGRGKKTWGECISDETELLGLQPVWAIFRGVWGGLDMENCSLAWKI